MKWKTPSGEKTQKTVAIQPSALEEYRQQNKKIASSRPLKKSKYTSIAKLDNLAAGKFGETKLAVKFEGSGNIFTIEEFAKNEPDFFWKILAAEEKPKDQYEALINSDFKAGFVLMVGKSANKTVLNLKIDAKSGTCAKYFIVIKEGVEVAIIEQIDTNGIAMIGETVYIMDGASATIAKMHHEQANLFSYQQCIIEKNASLVNNNTWLTGDLVRANTTNILNGDGASAKEYSLLVAKKNGHFDLNYSSIHRCQNGFSHCVFKSVLKDESMNVFDGMIRIEEPADKSNALLECHAMLLSDQSKSNQIPGLEIKTDDVSATHSATVARIDDEQIFYLASRGIPVNEARKMISESFLESVAFMLPQTVKVMVQRAVQENS